MVGDAPLALGFLPGEAAFAQHQVETVLIEEALHVVVVLVIAHEEGGVIACRAECMRQAADAVYGGVPHNLACQQGRLRVEGGVDAVVGVDAGRIGFAEGHRALHQAVEARRVAVVATGEGSLGDTHGFHEHHHHIRTLGQTQRGLVEALVNEVDGSV